MIKGILFDKDGTLIDFHELWQQIIDDVLKQIKEEFQWSDEIIKIMGQVIGYRDGVLGIESVLQYKATTEIIELWLDELELGKEERAYKAQRMLEIFNQSSCSEHLKIEPLGEVLVTLSKLKTMNLTMGIATADTYSSTFHSLKKAGLINYFCFFGTDSSEFSPKPSSEMAEVFCEKNGITCRELLIVGDSDNDRCFAQRANAFFVGLKRSYNRFAKHECNDFQIIEHFSELVPIVEALNRSLV